MRLLRLLPLETLSLKFVYPRDETTISFVNNPLQNTLLGGSLYYVVLPHNGVKVLLKFHVNFRC